MHRASSIFSYTKVIVHKHTIEDTIYCLSLLKKLLFPVNDKIKTGISPVLIDPETKHA